MADRRFDREGLRALALLRAVAVVGVAAAVLAACSSGSSSVSGTASAGGSAGGSTATTGSSGGSSVSSRLISLTKKVKDGQNLAFTATYTMSAGGTNQTITIEQKPPKSVFSASGSTVISDGKTTYVCSDAAGTKSCVTSGASGNPLASLSQLFSPSAALTAMQQAQAEVGASAAGYNVSFTSQTYAGQPSTCLSASGAGQSTKYCVTADGILAYGGTPGGSFELTAYAANPPDSDFTVPSGSMIPSGNAP